MKKTKPISAEKKVSRQFLWQQKQKAKGLCRVCEKKAINATYCKKHNQLNIKRVRKNLTKQSK